MKKLATYAEKFSAKTQWLGPYQILAQFALLSLLWMSLTRIALMLWKWDRVSAMDIWGTMLIQGVRADLIMVSFWVSVAAIAAPILANKIGYKFWRQIVFYWVALGIVLFVYLEIATPVFIAQYDVRPNRLFVEYLLYPKEVFTMLWNGFRLELCVGISLTIFFSYLGIKLIRPSVHKPQTWSWLKVLITWPLIVVILFACARSTTQHRPANPALFSLTRDALVNSLIINSPYSVSYALYSLQFEASTPDDMYGEMPVEDMLNEVKKAPWLQGYEFNNEKFPTLHYQKATIQRAKPLNLVILLQESLGATFIESLGGLPVTPEIEQLKSEGWWFENMYATGTRSVRGIEAVVAGNMPTPAPSVVKLSLSQQNFFTIADGLGKQGYQTSFMYGGEAHFDNMRSFFSGNGFQTIIDQPLIKNPLFVGSWGASDEDLYNTAHENFLALHKEGKPFFSLVFSSSNHDPFEFPDGRISLYEQPKQTVNNAVKYADYSIGEFIRKAKKSPYWKDTVFVIVADHDNRVYGDNLVPVHKFHIPALILGADIPSRVIKSEASQVDLAPTLFSMLGVNLSHPMLGRDFTVHPDAPGRAIMQFNDYFAWMENGQLTLLKPNGEVMSGVYDPQLQKTILSKAPPSPDMLKKAQAFAHIPYYLYKTQKYQAPK